MQADPILQLDLPRQAVTKMGGLLSQGVGCRTYVGISLWDFLCNRLGLEPAYIQQHLQTVFVNGRAVDRFDTLFIKNRDVIALSSAMPGLVGATLRRGGHLAGMRANISVQGDETAPRSQGEGVVRLKMFNIVAREAGVKVLANPVEVTGQALLGCLDFLQAAGYLADQNHCRWNEQAYSFAELKQALTFHDKVFLQIRWQ